jgi:hypothetical protein
MESGSDGEEDIVIRSGININSIPTARSVRDLQQHSSQSPEDGAQGQWRFSQCFGDKSEDADISDGIICLPTCA